MRVIQQDIIQALKSEKDFRSGQGRDRVKWYGEKFEVRLWGNMIAEGSIEAREITVSSCGYSTPTTTSRLNAVFAAFGIPLSAVIRNYVLMFLRDGGEVLNKGTKTEAGGWTVAIA